MRLHLVLLLGALAVPVVATSCSRDKGGAAFKVALVTPGPITDDGWNAYANEGLERIRSELGAEVRHVQTRSATEFESTLRYYAKEGFDLVIAHGNEYSDAARKVGAEVPETSFAVTSGNVSAANVASIRFAIEDAARLAGMLAAQLSKSGRIGCIGGVEIPPVKSAFDAFAAGAAAVRPDAKVVVSWVGSWEDVASAYQAAKAQLAQGADVLFHDADAAGLGVFNAAEEAKALAIGCNKDQARVKPNTVVASVVLEIPETFVRIARAVKEGRFEGKEITFRMKDGCVALRYNPLLANRVSEVMRKRIELAEKELIAGE